MRPMPPEPTSAHPSARPIPVVLDCDPGHDDAFAIAVAADRTELLGITAVSGNVSLDRTLPNALITAQILELDVPVHAGAARPLVVEPSHAEFIHGHTGLDGPTLPSLERAPASNDAVRFLIDTVRSRDDVWIVATGPLTNVALAMLAAPDLATRVAGISIMGGARGPGNVTPAAEFNIWHDPHAAAAVFASGARIVMAGLDLTHQWCMGDPEIARLRDLGSRAGDFFGGLLDHYIGAYSDVFFGRRDGPVHDPCAVFALSDPDLFERAERHVAVEVAGEHTRGMTVVDDRGGSRPAPPNAEVLTRIDAPAATERLFGALATFA